MSELRSICEMCTALIGNHLYLFEHLQAYTRQYHRQDNTCLGTVAQATGTHPLL